MGEAWALLLAAGESSRMGQLKALLPWRGQTLIEHQVSALRDGGVDRVVVVLGHRDDELRPRVESLQNVVTVHNPDYRSGKTTSIKAGLSLIDPAVCDAVLLLNVDQPRSAPSIARILARHRASGLPVTIPTYGGKGGHPIALSTTLMDELLAVDEHSLGIKAVVRRREQLGLRFPLEDPEILLDLNTPEQYRDAVANFST